LGKGHVGNTDKGEVDKAVNASPEKATKTKDRVKGRIKSDVHGMDIIVSKRDMIRKNNRVVTENFENRQIQKYTIGNTLKG
jgi:hypothetical protein